MSRIRKIAAVIGALFCLLLCAALALPVLLENAMQPVCANQVLQTLPAPDGKHSAILFERDCGATTGGLARHVALLAPGAQLPDDEAGFFVAVLRRGAPAPAGEPLHMQWLASGALQIALAETMEVFHRADRVQGVTILYQTLPATADQSRTASNH